MQSLACKIAFCEGFFDSFDVVFAESIWLRVMWRWCDMLYLLFCHVGCKWLSVVCKKCSCRTVLWEELLELGYGSFCCFLWYLEGERGTYWRYCRLGGSLSCWVWTCQWQFLLMVYWECLLFPAGVVLGSCIECMLGIICTWLCLSWRSLRCLSCSSGEYTVMSYLGGVCCWLIIHPRLLKSVRLLGILGDTLQASCWGWVSIRCGFYGSSYDV